MDLIIWRHAEAEDGVPDLARVLTEKGQDQAKRMARWLKQRLPENTEILCSPAERCQQTAMALSPRITVMNELVPGASYRTLLRATGWPKREGTVVLVNHQPSLGELAAFLLCGEPRGWTVRRGAIWWFGMHYGTRLNQTYLKAALTPDLL